jgi:hypothetical protein
MQRSFGGWRGPRKTSIPGDEGVKRAKSRYPRGEAVALLVGADAAISGAAAI